MSRRPLLALAALAAVWTVGSCCPARGGEAERAPVVEGRWTGEFRGIREILGGKLLFSVVVATATGSAGMMLLAAGLVPVQVERARLALQRGRWRLVFVGIVGVVVLLLAATLLGDAAKRGAPALGAAAMAVLGVLVWLAAVGLAATAALVGERLLRGPAGTQCAWRTVGAGSLAISASVLVPVFGAAVFLYLLCRGVGAAAVAVLASRGNGAEAAVPGTPPAGQ